MATSVRSEIRRPGWAYRSARAAVVVVALGVALPTAGALVDYATAQTPTFRRTNPPPARGPRATSAAASQDDSRIDVLTSRLERVEADTAANSADLKTLLPQIAAMQKDIEFMARVVWGAGAMIMALFAEMLFRRLTGK